MCEEPLVLLPVEQWDKLKAVFRSKWPQGISGYATLDIEKQIHQNGADYGFKAYVPYGDVINGLVGINLKGKFYEVIIQSTNEDTTDLVKALRHTKLIDWTRPLHIPFAPQHIVNIFKSIILEKNVTIKKITVTETFYIDSDAPYFDITLPPGFSFKLLTDEYAEISNVTWPHKHTGSIWYYHLLIKAKLGYGLFKDDELVAWCYVRETGALGHLYTLEQYRRRGFGELVLKLISNTLRREGKLVFAFCVVGNEAARKLYQKLNFSLTDEVEWCDAEPVVLPPGFSFKLLTDEYAEISNDTWPHKHTGSIWYYHLLIKAKLGYGLFKDDELVAWCYVKEMGALGHLYTLEQYRRRGFGELVLKLISNTLRREGKVVFAFCVVGNDAARNLYQKLNFSLTDEVKWCDIKPLV